MGDCADKTYMGIDRRSEPRSIVDKYSSVEFSIHQLVYVYQFKIWETSISGMSILVKEDSAILEHLKVGDVFDMKYYPIDSSVVPVSLKTGIKHITKDDQNRFRDHCLVGLTIIEKQS